MKVGDLVRVAAYAQSTYARQDEVGLVVRAGNALRGTLVLWDDGISLFARPDHLEVVNEELRK